MSNQYGTLYVIATPIGNLEDVSPRALEILKKAKYIAAEDTRHSRRLFQHYGFNPRVLSHHKFNEHKSGETLIKFLESGDDVALISDAGTPLISDPGSSLVRLCHNMGIRVVPIPGPSALICALSAAGLPAEKFIFEGFLPEKSGARRKRLAALAYETKTIVMYEAPHRIMELMQDLESIFGTDRTVVITRELTKKFETIKSGTISEMMEWLLQDPNQQKGEFVVVVEGVAEQDIVTGFETDKILRLLLAELPLNRAAAITSEITGKNRKDIYQLGLEIQGKKESK